MRAISWSTAKVHEAVASTRNGRPVWLPKCGRGKSTLVAVGDDATVTCAACGGNPAPAAVPAAPREQRVQLPRVRQIGRNAMTGTTHYARVQGPEGQLMQTCGNTSTQRLYLDPQPQSTPVSCRRCSR